MLLLLAMVAGVSVTGATALKRGTSGLAGCRDADALGLSKSWSYNWGLFPTHYEDSISALRGGAADPRAHAAAAARRAAAALGAAPPARPASLCNPIQVRSSNPSSHLVWALTRTKNFACSSS